MVGQRGYRKDVGQQVYLQKNHHRATEVTPCPAPSITFGMSEVLAIGLPEAFFILSPSTLQTTEPEELRMFCPSTFPTEEPDEFLIVEPSTLPIVVPDEERNIIPSNLKFAINFFLINNYKLMQVLPNTSRTFPEKEHTTLLKLRSVY